jgi:hypothetical protein
MNLTKEEIYHLIDLLDIDIEYKLNYDNTLLNSSQKWEAIKYDMELINKLKAYNGTA